MQDGKQNASAKLAYETFDGILDVSALDSLAYDKGSEIGADGKRVHTFDYIPISISWQTG